MPHLNGNRILNWNSFPCIFVRFLLLEVFKIIPIPGRLKFLNNLPDVLVPSPSPYLLCWADSSAFFL